MIARAARGLYLAASTAALIPAAAGALASRRWREGAAERLGLRSPAPARPGGRCLWIHGASVGEILAGAHLVERLGEAHPSARIVVSAFTVTGRELARRRFAPLGSRLGVTLLPLDWDGLPGRVLDRVRPGLFLILETELWPALLGALARRGVPTVIANGRLSSRSFPRYRFLRPLFGPLLSRVDRVCVRTERDRERFLALGARPAALRVAGNLKYDRVAAPESGSREAALRARLFPGGERPLLVAGSIRRGETGAVLEAFLALRRGRNLLLAIVPRHPGRFDVSALDRSGLRWASWSATEGGALAAGTDVVLVDTLGELADFYGPASAAFVGGSLVPRGGQNLLEAAFRGVPVLFGPDYGNFREEGDALLRSGGGEIVHSAAGLAAAAGQLLDDDALRRRRGDAARLTAEGFTGALEKTIRAVDEVLAP